MSGIKHDAEAQITGAIGEKWDLNDVRFERVKPWTFLLIQMQDSENALNSARKYNNDLSLSPDEQVLMGLSLFRSGIISYGKCFAESSIGRSTLDKNNVFKGCIDLKTVHERMIEIRNTFVAHNGNNDLDESIIAVLEMQYEVRIKHLYTVAHPLNEYDDFFKAITHCQEYLVRAINKHLDSIQRALGKVITVG